MNGLKSLVLITPIVLSGCASMLGHGVTQIYDGPAKEKNEISQENNLYLVVKAIIKHRLQDKRLSIDDVAASLCMTTRTLQRRLKEKHRTFRDVMEEARNELAQDYLTQGLSVNLTSSRLGYKSSINFINAYKSWHNKAPCPVKA